MALLKDDISYWSLKVSSKEVNHILSKLAELNYFNDRVLICVWTLRRSKTGLSLTVRTILKNMMGYARNWPRSTALSTV